MRTRKHVVAHECQALVAEPVANDLTAVVLDERTEIVRVDDLHFDTLSLNNAILEPAPIDPLAHFIAANVQRLGQQKYREPFPALSDAQAQPVQHRTNRRRGPAQDSCCLLDRNVVHQFDQTLPLPCGPLSITALFGHAEATQETQAYVAWIPRNLYKFREDLLSVATPMVPDLVDPLPVVRDQLPGLVRPMERAALWASITAIHTALVSKERLLLVDRRCASGLLALPSRIPPLLIYVRDSGVCNRENWMFWRKFFDR
jgi:hypothetical protein